MTRWTLIVAILGLSVTVLDSTVVLVALPAMEADLAFGLAGQQWVVDGYLLVLAAVLPVAGDLADRFGRRRMYVVGLGVFGVASALCGLAPSASVLLGARALQGVGAALVMPTTLALLRAGYEGPARVGAIAAWAAGSGIAAAVGPVVGGALIEALSWRWVFYVNLPVVAVAVTAALRRVPESRDPDRAATRLDLAGAVLAALALGGASFLLVEGAERGWGRPGVLAAGATAAVAGPLFVWWEARAKSPMIPLHLFRSRAFSSANAVTFVLYGAFQGAFFLLMIHLQAGLGFTPLEAGLAFAPVPAGMLLLGRPLGRLASRTGPRLPMTLGPLLVGAGLLQLSRLEPGDGYGGGVLPGVAVFALGLAVVVPVLTDTAVGAAPARQAGTASAVNNVAARAGALMAVAVAGLAFGTVFRAGLPAGADPLLRAARERPTAALTLPAFEAADRARQAAIERAFVGAYRTATAGAAATAAAAGLLAALWVPGPLRPRRLATGGGTG